MRAQREAKRRVLTERWRARASPGSVSRLGELCAACLSPLHSSAALALARHTRQPARMTATTSAPSSLPAPPSTNGTASSSSSSANGSTLDAPLLNGSSSSAHKHAHAFATRAIHVGSEPELSISGGVSTPLDLSTTYRQTRVGEHKGFECVPLLLRSRPYRVWARADELRSSRRYSRSANPTRLAYERLIASLEGADVLLATALREQGVTDPAKFEAGPGGLAFASGSAATATAIQALAGQGGHIVSVGDVYGGTSRCVELARCPARATAPS